MVATAAPREVATTGRNIQPLLVLLFCCMARSLKASREQTKKSLLVHPSSPLEVSDVEGRTFCSFRLFIFSVWHHWFNLAPLCRGPFIWPHAGVCSACGARCALIKLGSTKACASDLSPPPQAKQVEQWCWIWGLSQARNYMWYLL